MAKIVILGTANAVPDVNHENTHLLIQHGSRVILVDCVGNPIVRLNQAGISHTQVTDVIATHFHPDHVSGIPLLLMDMWLLGRKAPLTVHGLEHTVTRLQTMMEMYDWGTWPNFFPIQFNALPEKEMTVLLDDSDFRILASPVKHLLPSMGMRIEFKGSGKITAYSSDTEPCQAVIQLARNADVLIHEATGTSLGHTSPMDAGRIAAEAGARALYLIHYPASAINGDWVEAARQTYSGPVRLCQDFMTIDLDSGELPTR